MDEILISVITPTFNRGNLLKRCYLSLLEQSYMQFEWIVIDDGSTDDTQKIINNLQQQGKINIRYIYKENGGKHTALNEAFKIANGRYSIILDSDDYLSKDALKTIIDYWAKYSEIDDIYCISFLRGYCEGEPIGDMYPQNEFKSDYIEMRINSNVTGDKAETFVTKIMRENPFPVFETEKFLGESVLFIPLSETYKTIYVNKIIYFTEYIEGGLTLSGRKLRLKNPLGGMLYANCYLQSKRIKFRYKLKYSLLYMIYSYSAKKQKIKSKKLPGAYKIMYIFYPLCIVIYNYWNS